jgi:hypothetical protein
LALTTANVFLNTSGTRLSLKDNIQHTQ